MQHTRHNAHCTTCLRTAAAERGMLLPSLVLIRIRGNIFIIIIALTMFEKASRQTVGSDCDRTARHERRAVAAY